MKLVSHAVTDWLNSSDVRDRAKNTQKRRVIVLRMLVEVAGKKPVSKLESFDVDECLNRARDRGVEISTMNAYKSDLRQFGKWLHIHGYAPKADPCAHLQNQQCATPASKRKPLTAERAAAVIKHADSVHPRDGMTAKLMLLTGMRESEAIGLRWGDVEWERKRAKAYRPKIKDWHTVSLSTQLLQDLEEWRAYVEKRHGKSNPKWYIVPALAHRGERPGRFHMDPEWPMVPTRKQNSVGVRVKKWMAAAGEEDLHGRASHTLRRTSGNLLLAQDGANIRDVQKFFGHSSVSQTELYMDVDAAQERLSRIVQDFRI